MSLTNDDQWQTTALACMEYIFFNKKILSASQRKYKFSTREENFPLEEPHQDSWFLDNSQKLQNM